MVLADLVDAAQPHSRIPPLESTPPPRFTNLIPKLIMGFSKALRLYCHLH